MTRSGLLLVSFTMAALCFTAASAADDYVGSETCAACHEEVASAFTHTAHAVAPGWDADTGCESCHGPGLAHAESGGDTALVRLDADAPRESSQICMACHERQEKQASFKRSIHHQRDVGCVSCHTSHTTAENLLKVTSPELCAGCHQTAAAQFDMARSHPTEDCSGCHDPHATRSLRSDSTVFRETCLDCHFEKAGPYLYEHDVAMIDGCASCHAVHGSPNRHLLKHEPQVNLCYQCHSATVTPVWHSAPRFLNEKCTACHSAIHGSNTDAYFLEE